MRGRIFLAILLLILSLGIFSCAKKEEPVEEEKERVKNTFTDYVDTGRETLDQSKELTKEAEEKTKEMEKMLDDM
jgi:predicted nucleotide-binding protein (sugar kinase/HSP70/actin superfamily)